METLRPLIRYVRRRDRVLVASFPAIWRNLLHSILLEKCRALGVHSIGGQHSGVFGDTLLVRWTNIGGKLIVNRIEDCGFQAMRQAMPVGASR